MTAPLTPEAREALLKEFACPRFVIKLDIEECENPDYERELKRALKAVDKAAAVIEADGKRITELEAALYGDPNCSHKNATTKSKRCTSCPDCGHLLEILD